MVGDFDGDGFADLAVGIPGENDQSGALTTLLGSPQRLTGAGSERFAQERGSKYWD